MKFPKRLIPAMGILTLLLYGGSFSARADLIEPSRALGSTGNEVGNIWVFSEPPGLKVQIDSKEIGKTPVINYEVQPGLHTLVIKDKKLEIFVSSGKGIKLSLFKGEVVVLPDIEKISTESREPMEIKTTQTIQSDSKPISPEKSGNPFYWPQNPRGPIY